MLADKIIAAITSISVVKDDNLTVFPKKISKHKTNYVLALDRWLSESFGPNTKSKKKLTDCSDNMYEYDNGNIKAKIHIESQDICCESDSVKTLIGHGLQMLNSFFSN